MCVVNGEVILESVVETNMELVKKYCENLFDFFQSNIYLAYQCHSSFDT